MEMEGYWEGLEKGMQRKGLLKKVLFALRNLNR